MGCPFSAPRAATGHRADDEEDANEDVDGGLCLAALRYSRCAGEAREEAGAKSAKDGVEDAATLTSLPPELLLRVLGLLDVASLCAATRACRALWRLGADASLWRHKSLTVCSRPWPSRPPAALRALRLCSYRWPSARRARRELAWLAEGLGSAEVQRLELVGRHLDRDTLRACFAMCSGVRELSLHDVHVQDAWMGELAALRDLEVLHLDWHTEMSCQQMLQLAALCPSLSIIDTGDCPADCHAGRSRGVLQDALWALRVDLDVA